MMHDEIILSYLEELAEKLEILVRDENINIESLPVPEVCVVSKGNMLLFLIPKATVKEKIQVMIKALHEFDLTDMYVKPVIRELLDGNEEAFQ